MPAWGEVFRALFGWIWEVCLPRHCPGCDGPVPERSVFCADCIPALLPAPDRSLHGVPVLAAGCYCGPLEQATIALKYRSRTDLAEPLGRLLAERLCSLDLPSDTLIVPVPLHPLRLAERGYNQSSLLAGAIASELKLKCHPLALQRSHFKARQVGLHTEDRRRNVEGAFAARDGGKLARRHVILLDDVLTTGATATACLNALREANATPLAIVVLAVAGNTTIEARNRG